MCRIWPGCRQDVCVDRIRRKIRLIEVDAKYSHLKIWHLKVFNWVHRLEIVSHVGIFDSALWTVATLTFSLVQPSPPPFLDDDILLWCLYSQLFYDRIPIHLHKIVIFIVEFHRSVCALEVHFESKVSVLNHQLCVGTRNTKIGSQSH